MKFFQIAVFAALLSLSSAPIWSQNAPTVTENAPQIPIAEPAVRDAFDLLTVSIRDDDYAGFTRAVDDNFKTALTKEAFAKVVAQIAPLLKKGFKTTYFGQFKKNGFAVHLWKVEFDAGDDFLAEMSLKDQKIGGFFLR